MTLLQLIQAMTGEMGLAVPKLVSGSTDVGVIQLQALLNSLGREMARGYEWQALTIPYRFTTQFSTQAGTTASGSAVVTGLSSVTGIDSTYMVIGTGIPSDTYVVSVDPVGLTATLSQSATASGSATLNFCKTKYAMPSDYDRLVSDTNWDKSKHWQMEGPMTSQQWEWLKSGYISVAPRIKWKIEGGYFQIWPPQTTNEYLGFDYISNGWAKSSAGAGQSSLQADADTSIFPDELMIVGLKHKYTIAKTFAPLYEADWRVALSNAKAADGGATTLSMSGTRAPMLIDWRNIPDGGYGQT